jgi:hypothetical protein
VGEAQLWCECKYSEEITAYMLTTEGSPEIFSGMYRTTGSLCEG